MGRVVRAATLVRQPQQPPTLMTGVGRLQAGELGEAPPPTEQGGDGYLERVAKYVPAEIVGFFLFVNNILQEADKPNHSGQMVGYSVYSIAVLMFIVGLVLTPIYIWCVHKDGEAWKINAFVSTIAFPVWAYAMGAVAFDRIHDGNLASILLATFTVCSGLVKPPAQSANHDEKAHDDGNVLSGAPKKLTDSGALSKPANGGVENESHE